MAVDLPLNEHSLEHNDGAEETLERALAAWRAARARIDTVDLALLSPASRDTYFRLLVRIGLWADARMCDSECTEPDEIDGPDRP